MVVVVVERCEGANEAVAPAAILDASRMNIAPIITMKVFEVGNVEGAPEGTGTADTGDGDVLDFWLIFWMALIG